MVEGMIRRKIMIVVLNTVILRGEYPYITTFIRPLSSEWLRSTLQDESTQRNNSLSVHVANSDVVKVRMHENSWSGLATVWSF